MEIRNDEDFVSLKSLLLKEIQESRFLNETLLKRSQKLKEVLGVFESRIEFEDTICLKEGDIRELNYLI